MLFNKSINTNKRIFNKSISKKFISDGESNDLILEQKKHNLLFFDTFRRLTPLCNDHFVFTKKHTTF